MMKKWKKWVSAVVAVTLLITGSCEGIMAAQTDMSVDSEEVVADIIDSQQSQEAEQEVFPELSPEEADTPVMDATNTIVIDITEDPEYVDENLSEDSEEVEAEDEVQPLNEDPLYDREHDLGNYFWNTQGVDPFTYPHDVPQYLGLDISQWQGTMDFEKAKKAGVKFVIIRCGYRTTGSGVIGKDTKFDEYMQGAIDAGLDIGVYFFTQAITPSEALEEAKCTLEWVEPYRGYINLPIAFDYEYDAGLGYRLEKAKLSTAAATNICDTFCNAIEAAGYDSMIYSGASWLSYQLDGLGLASRHYIWAAGWGSTPEGSVDRWFSGEYQFWQSGKGTGSTYGSSSPYIDLDMWYDDGSFAPVVTEPKLHSVGNAVDGILVQWDRVTKASAYRVYRQIQGSDTWEQVAETTKLAYLDTSVNSAITYSYCVSTKIGDTWSEKSESMSTVRLKAPEMGKIVRTAKGADIRWSEVKGAAGYNIYRKTGDNGSWKLLDSVEGQTTLNYEDLSLDLSKRYWYTVRAYNGSQLSGYDTAGSRYASVGTPVLNSVLQGSKSLDISWGRVSGAKKYYIYRKEAGDATWTMLGNTTELSYKDTTITPGVKYYYTVRAYCANTWSYFDEKGVSGVFLKTPKLTALKIASKGTKVSWAEVKGAHGYWIYRKSATGKWTKIGSVKADQISYVDTYTKGSTGTWYYTVRAYSGTQKSGYDATGAKYVYLKKPVLNKPKQDAKGIKLTWTAVPKATKYRVYRRTKGSDTWVQLANVTTTSYIDTTAKPGVSYYYTLRAYATSTWSNCDLTGTWAKLSAAP